ncbi:ABC transporter substrate-binding protein [Geomicrobium sp. JCM 19038]|uniref:ABC transporter substrate-binding protein n=1 Tax=Geomicrobium sp. JCM 19038 TaxID=1460635 RepID=UPI001EE67181|nr:ABC transporter substrate-binding protein [Geomicrobium sp. JCM 19038]
MSLTLRHKTMPSLGEFRIRMTFMLSRIPNTKWSASVRSLRCSHLVHSTGTTADELAPAWEELGGEVVYDGSIDFAKETDFFTTITNALSDDPDVLFVGGSSEPTAQVMQQARELGFEGGFFIMDQAKLDEIERVLGDNAADVIEGSVGVPPLVVDQTEGNQQFIEDYIEHYDSIPGSEAGYHYYVVYILAEAMKAAGSVDDAAAIQANLGEGVNTVPADKEIYQLQK